MTARERADRLLVARGLFDSRAKAQAAIAAGLVTADDRPVRKASDGIPLDAKLTAAPAFPWVSRGGVKLAHALDRLGIGGAGHVCLHVGASTGGVGAVPLPTRGRRGRVSGCAWAAASPRGACAAGRRSSRSRKPISARAIRPAWSRPTAW